MPGHTGGHQRSGYGPTGSGRARGPGGGSQIGGKNRDDRKSFSEKLAEARAKNQRQRAQVEANQARARAMNEYNKATGIMTKQGFLRDKFGNLVRSKTQVDRINEQRKREKALRDAITQNIQAQEAKQVTPTQSRVSSVVDRMRQDRQNLLDRAKRNRITNQQLNQLSKLNRDLGFNRTTGMGIIESFRDTFSDPAFRTGIGDLARAYSRVSPLGIIMRNILNPQFDEPEPMGIGSLPDFQGLQRTNMMFGPGVYDFTGQRQMPMTLADASQATIGQIQRMKDAGLSEDFAKDQFKGTEVTPEEVEGIYRGTITSPTGRYAII
jgi:hypothetical protein